MYLLLEGDYACFTMPEAKVERMSYPFITPSSARSVISAVFWRPAIRWVVRSIKILRPISYLNFRRNELKGKISGKNPVSIEDARTQRISVILKNVSYEVDIEPILTPKGIADKEPLKKFTEMLKQRLKRGQHYSQPYLGCREFAAEVSLSDGQKPALDINMDILMFYDRFYPEDAVFKKNLNDPKWKKTNNFFFQAKVKNGIVSVPSREEIMGVYA